MANLDAVAANLSALGDVALTRGGHEEAMQRYEQVLAIGRNLGGGRGDGLEGCNFRWERIPRAGLTTHHEQRQNLPQLWITPMLEQTIAYARGTTNRLFRPL